MTRHRRSPQQWTLALLLTASSAWIACGDDGDDGAAAAGSGGGGGGTGTVCYDVPVNTTDGGEACNTEMCPAGQYCSGIMCDNGCVATATCARGQYCDLSASVTNPPVGTCRVPGPEHVIPCGTGGAAGAGGTGPTNCQPRCVAKATLCDPDNQLDEAVVCAGLCAKNPTATQLDCVESSSCQELEQAFVGGGTLCGLSVSGITP